MFLKSPLPLSTLLVGLGFTLPTIASDQSSSRVVPIEPYIINGQPVSTASYPYMALLFFNRLDDVWEPRIDIFCGATLLDERHVLTAAHCLYQSGSRDFSKLEVVFNVDEIRNDAFDRRNMVAAESVYYPDTYQDLETSQNNDGRDDIAVIKLAEPVSSSVVSPNHYVPLTSSEAYQSDGIFFRVLGYGKTGPDSNSSNTLQAAEVEYVQPEQCNQSFNLTLNDNQICVKGKIINNLQTGACGGDSGGPLLYEERGTLYQVGIVSFGPKECGNPNIKVQSVYTKVSGYSGWIANVLNGTEAPKYTINQQTDDSNSDSSSGGAFGIFSVVMILFLSLIRKNKQIRNQL